MRVVKLLFLLVLLAYGGLMGYLWYDVKSNADKMIQSAAPFATISYDSIHLSPMADELGLNDIRIKPVMTEDEFRIERLHFYAPHAGYFISANQNMKKGNMPENLGVKIERIHVDLNSSILTMLEQSQQQAAMMQGQSNQMMLSNLDALGCGNKESFTLSDYRNMGIGDVVADIAVDIGYEESSNRTHIKIDSGVDNLYTLDANVDMDTPAQGVNAAQIANIMPEVTLNYRDTGYYRLRNDFCAKSNESSTEEYIDRHIRLLGEHLDAHFPQPTVDAYRKLMLKGGEMNIKLKPSSDLDLAGLPFYKPADIIDMLGMKLTINGKRLDNSKIQWGAKDDTAIAEKPPVMEEKTPTVVAAPALRPTPTHQPSPEPIAEVAPTPAPEKTTVYANIATADAGNYLGKMIEVTTREGKVRSGVLDEINTQRIYLQIKLRAGSLNYPVEIANIERLRIQR